ncbi:MAG: hypothetical protein ACYC9O_04690 [Candidatus Latescibacterota bacterium]
MMQRFFRSGITAITAVVIAASSIPAAAQMDISYIDRKISKSKTFEFDYYGTYDYLKSVTDRNGTSNWNNRLMFNRNIENTYSGNWQQFNFEIARNKTGKNKKQITRLDSKAGGKKYIGNSPYFMFGVFEAREYGIHPAPATSQNDIFKGSGIYSFFSTGGGGGKVLDIANSIRTMKTLDVLKSRGYLEQDLPEDLFNRAMELLRQKKESTRLAQELNAILAEAKVLSKETFDADTIFALGRVLDSSADKLETGLEWRAGLGHELSKENSRQDKLKLIGGRVYYGKAFNDRMGVVESLDFLHGWGTNGTGNNIKSLARLTHSMVKTELSFSWGLTADMRTYNVLADSTRRDYQYSSWFNELAAQYTYEIYNRINLSLLMKVNRKDYHNDFAITSQKRGWNREFHAMLRYEIF